MLRTELGPLTLTLPDFRSVPPPVPKGASSDFEMAQDARGAAVFRRAARSMGSRSVQLLRRAATAEGPQVLRAALLLAV